METSDYSSFDPPINYSSFDSILMSSLGIATTESTEVSFDFPGHSPETVSKFEAINNEIKTISVANSETEQYFSNPIGICSQPKHNLVLDCISPSMLHKKTGEEALKLDNEQLIREADEAIDSALAQMYGGSRPQCCSPISQEDLFNDVMEIIHMHFFPSTPEDDVADKRNKSPQGSNTQPSRDLETQSTQNVGSSSNGPITKVCNSYQVETPITSRLLEPIQRERKLSSTIHYNGKSSSPYSHSAPRTGSNGHSPLQVLNKVAVTQPSPQGRHDFNLAVTTLQNGQGSSSYHTFTAVPTPSPCYSTPGSNSSASSTPDLTQSPYHSPHLEPVYKDLEVTCGAGMHSPLYTRNVAQNGVLPHYSDSTKPLQTTVPASSPMIQQELAEIKFTSPILRHMNSQIVQSLANEPNTSTSKASKKKKDVTPRVPKRRGRPPKAVQLSDFCTPSTSSLPSVAVGKPSNSVVNVVKPHQDGHINSYPLTQYIEVQPTQARNAGFSHQHGMTQSQIVNARPMPTARIPSQNVLQPQNGSHISYQNSANANLHRPGPAQSPTMTMQNGVRYSPSLLLPRTLEGIHHSNEQMFAIPDQSQSRQMIMQQGISQQTHNFPQPQRVPSVSDQQLYQPHSRSYQMLPQSAPQISLQRGHNIPAPILPQADVTPQPVYQHLPTTINQQQGPIYRPQQSVIVSQQQPFQRMPMQLQPMMMSHQPMASLPVPTIRKRRSQSELSGPPQQVPRLPTPAPVQQYSNAPHVIMNGHSPMSPNAIPLPGFGTFSNRF